MNKSKIRVLLVGVTMAVLAAETAHSAPDPFVADYNGNCKGAQCYIDITKKGTAYNLAFSALGRMDASKTLCKLSIPMTRQKGKHDLLVGKHKGKEIRVSSDNQGSIYVNGQVSCGKFAVKGSYSEYADY